MNEVWSGMLSGIGLALALLILNIFYSSYKRIKLIVFIKDRLYFYYSETNNDNFDYGKYIHVRTLEALIRELNVIVETRGKNLKEDQLCGLLNRIRYFEAFLEKNSHHIELNGISAESYEDMFLSIEEAKGTKFLNFTTKSPKMISVFPVINGNVFTNST